MGFGSCDCPLPAAIPDITPVTCGQNLGQIQKLVIGRRQASPRFPEFSGGGAGSADLLASWDVFKSAADDTKLQATPFIENFIIAAGTAITRGGDDNTTINGITKVVGAASPQITGNFASLPSATLKELKQLNCEEDLVVFLINEFGKIIGLSDGGTTFEGIPIQTLFIGDPGNQGKNTDDQTPFQASFAYGWADDLAFCTPSDFNARLEL